MKPRGSDQPHDLPERDIALSALSNLAGDTQLELPDPRLERRLLREAKRRSADPRSARRGAIHRHWAGNRVVRWVATVTVGLLLMGATFQATGLWTWWYSSRIGDHDVAGRVDGDGTVRADYTTPDGYRVTVRLAQSETPAGRRTRFESREAGHGQVEEEHEETIPTRSPAAGRGTRSPAAGRGTGDAPRNTVSLANLAGTRVLHTWNDPADHRWALHLGDDPDGNGCLLLAHDMSSTASRPVHVVMRTPFRVGTGSRVAIAQDAAGHLRLRVADGRGEEILARFGGAASGEAPLEFRTPSGRVRARVGDTPPDKHRSP